MSKSLRYALQNTADVLTQTPFADSPAVRGAVSRAREALAEPEPEPGPALPPRALEALDEAIKDVENLAAYLRSTHPDVLPLPAQAPEPEEIAPETHKACGRHFSPYRQYSSAQGRPVQCTPTNQLPCPYCHWELAPEPNRKTVGGLVLSRINVVHRVERLNLDENGEGSITLRCKGVFDAIEFTPYAGDEPGKINPEHCACAGMRTSRV